MDADDLALFRGTLRHAAEEHTGPDLDAALFDVGWAEALAFDPAVAVPALFDVLGGTTAASSALDAVLLQGLGLGFEAGPTARLVLPALGTDDPPGRLEGDRLSVAGLGLTGLADHDAVRVVARDGDKDVAVVVPTTALELRPVHGVDPWLGLVEVTGTAVGAEGPAEPVAWDQALVLGRLAVAHELVGASRRMLDLARTHAVDRIQFGRPIAQFQAVRHRLAEALVAIEAAEGALAVGWEDPTPTMAAMAKALAGTGARTTSKHAQQVLAGIGFTTEHPLHRSVFRVLVLDELLGSARLLTTRLGEAALADRRLPPTIPL